jgi:hypothetical protein
MCVSHSPNRPSARPPLIALVAADTVDANENGAGAGLNARKAAHALSGRARARGATSEALPVAAMADARERVRQGSRSVEVAAPVSRLMAVGRPAPIKTDLVNSDTHNPHTLPL